MDVRIGVQQASINQSTVFGYHLWHTVKCKIDDRNVSSLTNK